MEKTIKALVLILILGLTVAFKVPEIPRVGPFKKEAYPSKLLSKVQEAIVEAFVAGATRYSRESYEQAIYFWSRAQEYLKNKNYSQARRYLQKSQSWAQKAYQEAINKRKELLEPCLKEALRLREDLANRRLPKAERLELLLKISDLEAACRLEAFDEAHDLAQKIAQKLNQSS
ncbi:hypothetical protein [Thermosulfuriphilus sp.]